MTTTRRDTTASQNGTVHLRHAGLSHARTISARCQGQLPSAPSTGILLLNFELPYREQLALVLRHLRYQIFVPEEQGLVLRNMKDKEFQQADFVLFDLTSLNHDEVWIPLRRICRLRKSDGMPVMVHCFSRIYRGPDFHLLVEKLGARMAYYAE